MTSTDTAPAERTRARRPRAVGRFCVDTGRAHLTVRTRRFGLPVTAKVRGVVGRLDVPDDLRATSMRLGLQAGVAPPGSAASWWRRDTAAPARAVAAVAYTADRLVPILDTYVTPDGDRPLWALDGWLTINGCTRPLRAALCVLRQTAGGTGYEFEATATVRPADFGVGGRRWGRGGTVHVRVVGLAGRTVDRC